jgi:sterol desaturase/sphingolipid hydroxylase (fatty acid hydroxylase superfamily)
MIEKINFNNLFETLNQYSFKPSLLRILSMFFILCLIMLPLEHYFSGRKRPPVNSKSYLLNLLYWFFTPMFIRPFTNLILIFCMVCLAIVIGESDVPSIMRGFGPVIRQPLWLQIIEILLLADLIEYWVHRTFHKSRLWKIHAIHHSAEQMNWLASARMHPLNDLCTKVCQFVPLVAAGFPVSTAALVVPYLFIYVIFLHSDIDWDFGPLRYVLVSPVYHHWHHSSEACALDKNFAGIFPIWDVIFGTCFMPGYRASKFGVIRETPPESMLGQLIYPFKPFWDKRK